MAYKVKTIPLKHITKIQLYLNPNKKTLDEVMKETGARYGINGTLYNPNWTPCGNTMVDGKVINKAPWNGPGLGWTTGRDLFVGYFPSGAGAAKNYLSGNEILSSKGAKVDVSNWGEALSASRGRTAVGIDSNDNLVIYSCLDGTNALTPIKLQIKMANLGCTKGAINLDGGTSVGWYDADTKAHHSPSKGFVQNYLLIWYDDTDVKEPTKQEENPMSTPTGVRKTIKDLKITEDMYTKNPTYTNQIKRTKKKFMLHSTATPGAKRNAFKNSWNSANAGASVEFIADYEGVVQTLPLGIKSWHGGGNCNNTHVALEMCEPPDTRVIDINWIPQQRNQPKNRITWAVKRIQQELVAWGYDPKGVDGVFGPGCEAAVIKFQKDHGLTGDGSVGLLTIKAFRKRKGSLFEYDPNTEENKKWFEGTYENAVLVAAWYLTKMGSNPLTDIDCHSEGYTKGIASNHADVMHWFPKHGKTMDDFRNDVKVVMEGGSICGSTTYPKGSDIPAVNPDPKPSHAENVQVLVEHGVIDTPDYWIANETDGFVPLLISKMANYLRENDKK